MPEELAIVLIVLVGAVWLIVKIFGGLASAIDELTKMYERANAKRHQQKKNKLSRHVRIVLPGEIEKAERQLSRTEDAFNRFQLTTEWIAGPPTWNRESFVNFALPVKRNVYEDSRAIFLRIILANLKPNSVLPVRFAFCSSA